MYDEVKALVSVISEDEKDYPDSSSYRMVMDKLAPVKDELEVIEASRRGWRTKQQLQESRERIANEEWEKADLTSHIESDDIHIESDGWETDDRFFSRCYYVSIDGVESEKHHFLVSFVENTDEVADTDCS